MRIHHFYPRTRNIGDHFVSTGIQTLIHSIRSDAQFESFDINSRGSSREDYGLTHSAIQRANREADLVVVGGSNLYEGALGWPWGVHLDRMALKELRVPLFLIGIGTGSAFASPLHRPSSRAKAEIVLLNEAAAFSWTRDVVTLEWLRKLGINKAEMLGDPASFLFNAPYQSPSEDGCLMIVVPPFRVWSSRRNFVKSTRMGRPIFRSLVELARSLTTLGLPVVIVCNDPLELPLVNDLFGKILPKSVVCPTNQDEYLHLLSGASVVVTARLHTAAVALSKGIPFLLLDLDQRTRGFIETYDLSHAKLPSSRLNYELPEAVHHLRNGLNKVSWLNSIRIRDELHGLASRRLQIELQRVGR